MANDDAPDVASGFRRLGFRGHTNEVANPDPIPSDSQQHAENLLLNQQLKETWESTFPGQEMTIALGIYIKPSGNQLLLVNWGTSNPARERVCEILGRREFHQELAGMLNRFNDVRAGQLIERSEKRELEALQERKNKEKAEIRKKMQELEIEEEKIDLKYHEEIQKVRDRYDGNGLVWSFDHVERPTMWADDEHYGGTWLGE